MVTRGTAMKFMSPTIIWAAALASLMAGGCNRHDNCAGLTALELKQTSFALKLLARDYQGTHIDTMCIQILDQIQQTRFDLAKDATPIGAIIVERGPYRRLGIYWLACSFDVHHVLLSSEDMVHSIKVSNYLRMQNIEEANAGSRLFSIRDESEDMSTFIDSLLAQQAEPPIAILLNADQQQIGVFDRFDRWVIPYESEMTGE